MKKCIIFFMIVLISSSFALTAAADATFTLNAHVRGITVHGFVKEFDDVDSNGPITVLKNLLELSEFGALDGPADPMLKAKNLTLGYNDIEDFDFGEDEYEDVAYYLFLSNMANGLKVSFTISDFKNKDDEDIVVPWKLGVTTVNSDELTIQEGQKSSGPTVHTIATATTPLAIRFAILKLSLYFEPDNIYVISGDYTATVIASITAS